MIQFFIIAFRIIKIVHKTLWRSQDPIPYQWQLISSSSAWPDFLKIVIKMTADHFRISKSDIGNPQAVNYFCKCCFFCPCPGLPSGYQRISHQTLPSSTISSLMFPNLKNISEIMNEPSGNKFLQCCLRQVRQYSWHLCLQKGQKI